MENKQSESDVDIEQEPVEPSKEAPLRLPWRTRGRELVVQRIKCESIEWGKANLLEIARVNINDKEMISFTKFFKSADGKRFPKGFALPLELKQALIEAIQKVSS